MSNVMREFQRTHYLDVKSGFHRAVTFYIYRDNGTLVSFEERKVIIILYLRKN